LFLSPHKAHKYILWTESKFFLMFDLVVLRI